MPFAVRMVQLLPELLKSAEGKPVLPECVNMVEGPRCFQAMDFDLSEGSWTQEANLLPVLRYLRGNTHLELPDLWRAVMPTRL